MNIFTFLKIENKWRMPLPSYFKVSLIVALLIIVYSMIIFFIMIYINKHNLKPGKFMRLNIGLVKKFNNFIKANIGRHWRFSAPMVLTLTIYIALLNIAGLFAVKTPTQKLSITVALAIFATLIVQLTGISSRKFKHLKTPFEPIPIMFPINLLGDFTPIISMSLRLFGNIVAGGLIVGMVYGFAKWASPILTPLLHLVFDVGFGMIQTFVFTTLTVIFTSNKVEEKDLIENK